MTIASGGTIDVPPECPVCGSPYVAGELGSTGIGYDINDLTTSYGRQKHNLDLRSEFWTSKTDTGPFDVMLCISVLEHVDRPRGLMAEMAEACRRERAALFISVPLLDEDKWPFILDPTPTRQGTPFFDNDVHVTHFSSLGLEKAMWEHGAAKVDWLREGLWHGTVARF